MCNTGIANTSLMAATQPAACAAEVQIIRKFGVALKKSHTHDCCPAFILRSSAGMPTSKPVHNTRNWLINVIIVTWKQA